MIKQQMIAFTADKNGKPVAYKDTRSISARWVRVSYEEAKLLVATGAAREVAYVPIKG